MIYSKQRIRLIITLFSAVFIMVFASATVLAEESETESRAPSMTIKANQTELSPGDTTDVTVSLTNASDYFLNDVALTAALPGNLELVSGSLTENTPLVGIGETKSYSFTVKALSQASASAASVSTSTTPKKPSSSSNPKTGSPESGVLFAVLFLAGAAAVILFLRKKRKASKVLALVLVFAMGVHMLSFFPVKAQAQDNTAAEPETNQEDTAPASDYSGELSLNVGGQNTKIAAGAHINRSTYLNFPMNGNAVADDASSFKLDVHLDTTTFKDELGSVEGAKAHLSLIDSNQPDVKLTSASLSNDKKTLHLFFTGKVNASEPDIIFAFDDKSLNDVYEAQYWVLDIIAPDPFLDMNAIKVMTDSENAVLRVPFDLDTAQLTDNVNPNDFKFVDYDLNPIAGAVVTNVEKASDETGFVSVTIPGKTANEIADILDDGALAIDGPSINCDILYLDFILPVFEPNLMSSIVGTPTIVNNGDGTATITAVFRENMVLTSGGMETSEGSTNLTNDAIHYESFNDNVNVESISNASGNSFQMTISTKVAIPVGDDVDLPEVSETSQTTSSLPDLSPKVLAAEISQETDKIAAKDAAQQPAKANGQATDQKTEENQNGDKAADNKETPSAQNSEAVRPESDGQNTQNTQQQTESNPQANVNSQNVSTLEDATKNATLNIADYQSLIEELPASVSISLADGSVKDNYGFDIEAKDIIPLSVGTGILNVSGDNIMTQAWWKSVLKGIAATALIVGGALTANPMLVVGGISLAVNTVGDIISDATDTSGKDRKEASKKYAEAVQALKKVLDAGFATANRHVDAINNKIDRLNKKLDKIEGKVDSGADYQKYTRMAAANRNFRSELNQLDSMISTAGISNSELKSYVLDATDAHAKGQTKKQNKALYNLCRSVDMQGGMPKLLKEIQEVGDDIKSGGDAGTNIFTNYDNFCDQTCNWNTLTLESKSYYRIKVMQTYNNAVIIATFYNNYYMDDPHGYYQRNDQAYNKNTYKAQMEKMAVQVADISKILKKDVLLNQLAKGENPEEFKTITNTVTKKQLGRGAFSTVLKKDDLKTENVKTTEADFKNHFGDVTRESSAIALMKGRLMFFKRYESLQEEIKEAGFKLPDEKADLVVIASDHTGKQQKGLYTADTLRFTGYNFKTGQAVPNMEFSFLQIKKQNVSWFKPNQQ